MSGERCIFDGCVATWAHYHGGFPGGYQDPAFPDGEGLPIYFTGPDPDPTAVRDYNGAALTRAAAPADEEGPIVCRECGESREAPQHGLDGILAPGTADWAIHVFAAIHQQDTDRAAR